MKRHDSQTVARGRLMLSALAIVAVAAAGLGSVGCAGGDNSGADNPGKAGGSSSAEYNTYVGTQTVQWSTPGTASDATFQYGGVWDLSIDDSTEFFDYQNVGHQGQNYFYETSAPYTIPGVGVTLGSLTGNGFLDLTPNGDTVTTPGSYGYALEIPGEAAMLRPGDDTNPPVVAVETSSCLTLTGTPTYQFISLGTPNPIDPIAHVAYGSVQASASGVTWTFSNLKMYAFDGTDLQPTALPTGGCGETAEGFAVSIAPSTATNNVQVTAQAGPSGFFIMDQGQGEPSQFNVAPGATGPIGLVGVEQPSSQLTTSAVVAGKYLGFEFDAIDDLIGRAGTLPVSFGTTAGSGTVMTGGGYKGDDVTQTPGTDIVIDLGAQDAQNGLYKSVTVTVPDPYGKCAAQAYGGTNASGEATCTYTGEAVVGNPGGKYAIFVTVNDIGQQNGETNSGTHYTKYGALDFFLYQQ